MNKEDYIDILDKIASGIDPFTGDTIPNESILKKRQVIRALQFAIDSIYENMNYVNSLKYEISLNEDKEYILEKENIVKILSQFNNLDINPTITTLTRFLLGFENIDKVLFSLEDYGILKSDIPKKRLQRYISNFFKENTELIEEYSVLKDEEWKNINLDDYKYYNKLKPEYIQMFKERVAKLPDKLTEEKLKRNPHALELRKKYPRAYESYSNEENELLNKAFNYANDVDILCDIFQRNDSAIKAKLKQFYYKRSKENNT